jgi:FMN phosphatase YigB (HAD superfamily)
VSFGAVRFRAVLFDWRGTLATTPTTSEWLAAALTGIGRTLPPGRFDALARMLHDAEPALDGPGVDSDPVLHRRTYLRVFGEVGLDDDLAGALYAVESDPGHNLFADDVADTLTTLKAAGLSVAVVSDIHVDIRPAFAAAGLGGLVDVFTLSYEQGRQKPDPLLFGLTLDALGVAPAEALMVGDRAGPDGGAVDAGLTALLLPPLRGPADRRLSCVPALCGVT